eukprot:TRINITY_DN78_c7_g1_i1.p1 TRINITY_DN78_c7_g1~~TRINITY_DN78_c7_g1_i1.p1  ORF type:complete len:1102 (+),score=385.16 TRINITY_DN78_c7_g1_i1:272-3577(+)
MDWAARMRSIVDFSSPAGVDPAVFDQVVAAAFDCAAGAEAQQAAMQTLAQYQQHPESWTQAGRLLEGAQRVEAKYIALQTLDAAILSRWNLMSDEQRLGIRNFIVGQCMTYSADPASLVAHRLLLEKLNFTLVQILKREWPERWPSFIQDIVESSKGSDSWMQNNLAILRQLSEEIFDFSKGRMKQEEIKQRKEALNKEFMKVFEMVVHVLEAKQSPQLLCECLRALERFLSWIPLGYIFQTELITILGSRFLPQPLTREAACRCLAEIGSLSLDESSMQYQTQLVSLYVGFSQQMVGMLPAITADNCAEVVPIFTASSGEAERFVTSAALFYISFHRNHLQCLEQHSMDPSSAWSRQVSTALRDSHFFLVSASFVDDKELFKTVVEYWQWLAEDVHKSMTQAAQQATGAAPQYFSAFGGLGWKHPRQTLHQAVFSLVRQVLVKKMARPEEVIVFEDENGEMVKERMKDVDALALYEMMREALVFLTHIDSEDTEQIMLERLGTQVDPRHWSSNGLATLCWAVGSISGSMGEGDERSFVVIVLRDLLGLCDVMRTRQNKASVASNIMYVVGQYPRFLRAHWRFLRVVVMKLFEFMRETTVEGVQDMACETFLKICHSCKEEFVVAHLVDGEQETFIEEMLRDLAHHTQDLNQTQMLMFYEATGVMISAAPPAVQGGLVSTLLTKPNLVWQQTLAQAAQNQNVLADVATMRQLGHVIKVYVRAAHSVGPGISSQIFSVFSGMMKLYMLYSHLISQEVATKGEIITRHLHVRGMRIVKKEILRVVEEYVKQATDLPYVSQTILPPLLEVVLADYNQSVARARDAQVLSLMIVLVERLGSGFCPHVPQLLTATLQVTLDMIKADFTDFPEHRVLFFKMMKSLSHSCFAAFLEAVKASPDIVNSIVWALRHTEQSVQDTGLETLLELLDKVVAQADVAYDFFAVYLISLFRDVLSVCTDSMHKTGFSHHCRILRHLALASQTMSHAGRVLDGQPQGTPTLDFVRQRLAELLTAFPNVSAHQVGSFVEGMWTHLPDEQAFKEHVRDFLVTLKDYSADLGAEEQKRQEEERRRQEEAQRASMVPGLSRNPTGVQLQQTSSTVDICME